MLLQPDDARPHTLQTIMEATEKLDLTTSATQSRLCIMRFPPFSEDAGRHLWTSVDSVEEVERTVRTWMKKQSVVFFLDGFRNLVHRWRILCGE